MVILSRLLNPVTLKPVLARLDAGVEQMDAELAESMGVQRRKESLRTSRSSNQVVKGDAYDTTWITPGAIGGRDLVRIERTGTCGATIVDERS